MFGKLVAIICLVNYGLLQPCTGACGAPTRPARTEAATCCEPPVEKQACRRCSCCRSCSSTRVVAEPRAKTDASRDARPCCEFCPGKVPKAPFVPTAPTDSTRVITVELVPWSAAGVDGGAVVGLDSGVMHAGHDPHWPWRSHNERLASIEVWLN